MNKKEFKICIIPILISTIIVTILANFKFDGYDKYFMFPITILICTYIYLVNKQNMVVDKKGYIYLLPILLIIIGTLLFITDISNMILNIFVLPFLISFLFLKLTNKNYDVSGNFLKWFYNLFPNNLFSNLELVKDNIITEKHNNKTIKNILVGILLSIPFVFIIMSLLTSADMYFNVFINKLSNSFSNLFDIDYIKNNILIFIIYFVISFSVFSNIITSKNKTIGDSKKHDLEVSIVNTILVVINLVFVLFIISEISKLAGNFLQLPQEYTYAKYAREGFFQLLLVTVINFSIVSFLMYKSEIISKSKLLKKLVLLLLVFTILLIFNSYYRMFLYMYEYGFTILRTQVILFLLMELIIAGIFIKKIISKLKFRDSYTILWLAIATYVINIMICNINVIDAINNILGYPNK